MMSWWLFRHFWINTFRCSEETINFFAEAIRKEPEKMLNCDDFCQNRKVFEWFKLNRSFHYNQTGVTAKMTIKWCVGKTFDDKIWHELFTQIVDNVIFAEMIMKQLKANNLIVETSEKNGSDNQRRSPLDLHVPHSIPANACVSAMLIRTQNRLSPWLSRTINKLAYVLLF